MLMLALLLWAWLSSGSVSETPCPTKCLCVVSNHYTQTLDMKCTDTPSDNLKLPPSLSSIVYNNVSTTLLQSSNLVPTSSHGLYMIKIVYKRSGIETVRATTFESVPNLEHLDLSMNLISSIEESTFHKTTKLKIVNLSGNQLKVLPTKLFQFQNQLLELHLSQNKLEKLFTKAYFVCRHLKLLDLSFNQITDINDNINPSLITLCLNNNEIKHISKHSFDHLIHLKMLNLSNNKIEVLSNHCFQKMFALEYLDIESNEIVNLPGESFKGLTNLQTLNISKNPINKLDDILLEENLNLQVLDASDTDIFHITKNLLSNLRRLKVLKLNNNKLLTHIDDFRFSSSNHLQYINISFGNLTIIPQFISYLEMVEELYLDGNPWKCTCSSNWFLKWLPNHRHAFNMEVECDGGKNMIDTLNSLICKPPEAVNETSTHVLELRSNGTLTCTFVGNPAPSLTWLTPSGYVFHYYPNNSEGDTFLSHPRIHLYNLEAAITTHVILLNNGSLQIQGFLRQDAGIYTCLAINSLGNNTSHIVITLDRKTFYKIKIMCIIVGALCVAAVLVCTAIGQTIYWTCQKCGWIDERGKQLMQLREDLDVYKSQQLENLRENYTQQVYRIKENCALQVQWIRDSYKGQVKHIQDFKHYGSHQLSSIRDQYYDQMKKVRDYSTTQLGWVRENYVFQRNRIHKFSSHQVLRFRESYKYQQQALNKLLENLPSLNLDNCRGSSCGRSQSSVFVEDNIDLEVQSINVYAKTKEVEITKSSVLEEGLDEQSVYYTPSDLSDSPMTPMKELIFKKYQHDNVIPHCSNVLNMPPWLQDSPCHIFHCSQMGIQCPTGDDFSVPRTLQTSTSLPEMPQIGNQDVLQETAL